RCIVEEPSGRALGGSLFRNARARIGLAANNESAIFQTMSVRTLAITRPVEAICPGLSPAEPPAGLLIHAGPYIPRGHRSARSGAGVIPLAVPSEPTSFESESIYLHHAVQCSGEFPSDDRVIRITGLVPANPADWTREANLCRVG